MALSGYNVGMASDDLETTGIKNLRDNLSKYLERVALGVRVLVSDRGKVVAELREPSSDYATPKNRSDELMHGWESQGFLESGTTNQYDYIGALKRSAVVSKDGSWRELLDREREE